MTRNINFIAFNTIFLKEVKRVFRIWRQTLLPPVITALLYFFIFGESIGPRIGVVEGFSYIQFIVPGLIMLSVIMAAFANTLGSFYMIIFHRSIEELLVSSMPNYIILLGYVLGGMVRSLLVGLLVTCVSLIFIDLHIHHFGILILVFVSTAGVFSLLGFISAMCVEDFEQIHFLTSFFLTPLIYLGGVFYSLDMLKGIWRDIVLLNPILYIVRAFRYGFLGVEQHYVGIIIAMLVILNIVLFFVALGMLRQGVGVRT